MRTFLNAWLRQWAEASLRTELHQAQEKLIREKAKLSRSLALIEAETKMRKAKEAETKRKHVEACAYNERLINALRERVPPELFFSVCEYARKREAKEALK